jgi:hypothetical protein
MPKVTDARLGDTIEVWGGRKAPRAFALIALTNDWADHYSASAMYLASMASCPQPRRSKRRLFRGGFIVHTRPGVEVQKWAATREIIYRAFEARH